MSVYDREFSKMCPKTIAWQASPAHVENILKGAFDEIALLKEEKSEIKSQLLIIAYAAMHCLKNDSADPSWNGAIDARMRLMWPLIRPTTCDRTAQRSAG